MWFGVHKSISCTPCKNIESHCTSLNYIDILSFWRTTKGSVRPHSMPYTTNTTIHYSLLILSVASITVHLDCRINISNKVSRWIPWRSFWEPFSKELFHATSDIARQDCCRVCFLLELLVPLPLSNILSRSNIRHRCTWRAAPQVCILSWWRCAPRPLATLGILESCAGPMHTIGLPTIYVWVANKNCNTDVFEPMVFTNLSTVVQQPKPL